LIFARTSVQQVRLNLTDIALYKTSGTAPQSLFLQKVALLKLGHRLYTMDSQKQQM